MRYSIEIILKDDVQKIFDKFSSSFNIRVSFFSPVGNEISVNSSNMCNDFCTLIRTKLNKDNKCIALENEIRQKALEKKDMITYNCYAGMIESIIPIYFEGMHLGFFMLGRYRSSKKLRRDIIEEWKYHFGSPEKLVLAYLRTPCFTQSQIENIRELFRLIVNYIVSQNMIKIKGNLIIERILNYMKRNIEKNVTIQQVSDMVGRSTSSVSHIFSTFLHKSFKQIMIEMKLEKADEYLKTNSNITIKEVAYKLGYDDPYYFSRLYKKYRGFSPSYLSGSQ